MRERVSKEELEMSVNDEMGWTEESEMELERNERD